jgi:hypothetical protein
MPPDMPPDMPSDAAGARNFRKFRTNFFEKICLPPVCRPGGWVAIWRAMGNLSVLNRRSDVFS